jgi:hypothetical protein
MNVIVTEVINPATNNAFNSSCIDSNRGDTNKIKVMIVNFVKNLKGLSRGCSSSVWVSLGFGIEPYLFGWRSRLW